MKKLFKKPFVTYNQIVIDKSKFLSNLKYFANLTKKPVIAVLKSNAYGMGILEIGKILNETAESEMVAVDGYFEALELSKVYKKNILVMGAIQIENIKYLKKKFHYVVGDLEILKEFIKCNNGFKIHLEFDTGMHRHGFDFEKLEDLEIFKSGNVNIVGIMTHLSDVNSKVVTESEIDKFSYIVSSLLNSGISPKYIHCNSTGGAFYPSTIYTHCRIGAGLYGISPFEKTSECSLQFQKNIHQIFEVVSKVSRIFEIHKGDKVGYSGTYLATKKTKIAVIPFGYYEGLDRRYSNAAEFKIYDKFYKIAGVVCMNITMIEVDDTVQVGDRVVIYSSKFSDRNSLANISSNFNVSSYELCVRLSQTVRRFVID